MESIISSIPPKYRYYIPIVAGILAMVSIITLYSINRAQRIIRESIERTLTMELGTIKGMFEGEKNHKIEKVLSASRVSNDLFNKGRFRIDKDQVPVEATNQLTGQSHKTIIHSWYFNGRNIYHDTAFVDQVSKLTGTKATIFQRIDSGYLRISTNILNSNGFRAINTFIPLSSPVSQRVDSGKTFYGRAFVVNDWFYTAYEPIMINGKVIGMLYAGDKEKNLEKLRDILNKIKIGINGYAFATDMNGNMILHPYAQGENWKNEPVIDHIIKTKNGIYQYSLQKDKINKIVAYTYFEGFDLIIGATVPVKDESKGIIKRIVVNSAFIGLFVILFLSVMIYFVTAENVRRFLNQIEHSNIKRAKAERALEQTEKHFQAIFDNSGDDIYVMDLSGNFLEVNMVAIENLGYTRDELLKMNIRDIQSEKAIKKIESNIILTGKFGQYRYESENVTKNGKIIPVEMKSRIIDYRGGNAILTIARDISERKEIEDRILNTIIQTEDNERQRLAADLHDGLAPILSTIKLYTNLLKKGQYRNIDPVETVKNIEELVDLAITSTREISRNIRPNILQDFGLAEAISDFVSYINYTKSIKINLDKENYRIERRGIEESVLYQAVKELINNSIKHSSAQNIIIELKSADDQIILYYRDDGIGFDIQKAQHERKGLGLDNLMNKIKSIKGTVDLYSETGKGMFFIATVKIKK